MQASLTTIRDELRWALVSDPVRLDLVALAISRLDDDPFDDDEVLGALDAWAASVRDASNQDPAREIEFLTDMLGGKLGLRGDEDQYDDPENSFLPRVIERRLGLPILLSIVYIEVARRAAIPVFGVALPGHFVVGHQPPEGPLLVLDPFAGGRTLSLDQVALLVARTGATLAPSMLTPASAHTIATRMLRNLLGSYQRRARWEKALTIARLMQAIDPAADELN